MYRVKICLLVILQTLMFLPGFSQSSKEFKIYVLERSYDKNTREFIKNNGIFQNIEILNPAMIDPRKQNIFDFASVDLFLKKLYPEKGSSGLLFINIENRLYQDLKDYPVGSSRYKVAVDEFRKLIKTIRLARPNLKIGIYGIPYRTYYGYQDKWNEDKKLDAVLSLTDYLFPSLYLLYPKKQIGPDKLKSYLAKNLETAFSYGSRLNKPVIPFVWYVIHPINKRHGGELIGVEQMQYYLEFIKNYRSKNSLGVKGIVWWEPGQKAFDSIVKYPSDFKGMKKNLDKNLILKDYTRFLLR